MARWPSLLPHFWNCAASSLTYVELLRTFQCLLCSTGSLGTLLGYFPSVLRSFSYFVSSDFSVCWFVSLLRHLGSTWCLRGLLGFLKSLYLHLVAANISFELFIWLIQAKCRTMSTLWTLIMRKFRMDWIPLKVMTIQILFTCCQSLLPTCSTGLGRATLQCNP